MSTTKQVSIFIADDHLISRMGLKMLLQQTSTFSVIGEAEDGESAIQQVLALRPEVVIMDLDMPKVGGVEATAIIKGQIPETKVLIFTSSGEDSTIFAALKAGADGYCLKTISAEMLAIAIQSVLNGAAWLDPGIAHKVLRAQSSVAVEDKPSLSDSKLKLLSMLEEGKSVNQIASEFNVNDALVKGLLNELIVQLKGTKPDNEIALPTKSQPFTSIKPGDIIAGHYNIDERIGEGGMGCVYSATHTLIERKVAIKTLHEHAASGDVNRERFRTEAKASAAIIHPNLATIFDFGLIDNRIPYLVMEFLDGKSLAGYLTDGEVFDGIKSLDLFAQICDALHAVHSGGIVHRDLKPSNIMILRKNDGSYGVKLVDFGIAKLVSQSSSQLTCTGEVIGTPYYMSPEQCKSEPVDHRSDLYSLGCTMFAAFAGSPPFIGATAMETCMMHLFSKPDTTLLEDSEVPQEIITLVLSLMEKSPEDRPSSAAEVRKLLLKAQVNAVRSGD